MNIPELVLVPLPGRKWRVKGDFVIETKAYGWVHVPDGFVCDLNSMPRFLWWASTPTDYPEAGTVHDWLYNQQIPQKIADAVYLELLLALGMNSVRARARYRALRMFGGFAYRKHGR
jgi:hypothetical protein